ncbi:hypothetical protein [Streptomyces sp. TS71-3]|uniref:hypothetical protein n=1 Tax=Streptomyces sp. TS71-3 TaxID=2733862 RepID=UPI001B18D772|nr:hypothetical protein [Streptomyces sp. TS71-3]GHJ39950.1 hypothetical protein Sm713_55590 [Streptomyces sp. TS71-3]
MPRWAVLAAYAAALTTLPSGIWRIAAVTFHTPLLEHPAREVDGHGPVVFTGTWYVVALTVVSEALAFLTVGLVSEWGERVPRWIPLLGGRRIPPRAATIPAALGATTLTALFPYALLMLSLGRTLNGSPGTGVVLHGWQIPAFVIAYAPLAAWGPLLGVVTVHYHRRRARRAGRAAQPR